MQICFNLDDEAAARLRFVMAEHNASMPTHPMDENRLAQSLGLAVLDDDLFAHPNHPLDA